MPVALRSNDERHQERKLLETTITERKKYLADQEKLIKETTEAGNTQLMGLHHDILLAKQELRDLKTDIRTAAQDKKILNEDIGRMQVAAGGMVNAFA